MLSIILSNIPEAIFILAFLYVALDFRLVKLQNKSKYVKLSLLAIGCGIIASFTQDIFGLGTAKHIILRYVIGILSISVPWLIIFEKITFKRILQVVSGTLFIYAVILLSECYAPLLLLITNQTKDILDNPVTMFVYGIPARLMQGVFIYFVYRMQLSNYSLSKSMYKVASSSLTSVASFGTNATSWFWFGQPPSPKCLRKW